MRKIILAAAAAAAALAAAGAASAQTYGYSYSYSSGRDAYSQDYGRYDNGRYAQNYRYAYRDSDRDGVPDRAEWNRDRDRDGRPDQYDRYDNRRDWGHSRRHHHRHPWWENDGRYHDDWRR